MSEINQKIIQLISESASLNTISTATGLTNKQIFRRLNMLRNDGYNFARKYFYNGDIIYDLQKSTIIEKNIALLTSPKDNQLKLVFISDLHLTNKMDNIDSLNQIYEYCINEGIHIIINCGDLLDGFYGDSDKKKFTTSEQQIEYLLKNYPYDKNILNFICLGNHDYSILKKTGQNLETILSIKRHDMVSLGYGIGKLKVKNEEILIKHFAVPIIKHYDLISNNFTLIGHTHRSQSVMSNNKIEVYVPSLSNMQNGKEKYPFPGFISASIDFKKGYFEHITLHHYIIIDKIYKINETEYYIYNAQNINDDTIKYEQEIIPYNNPKKKTLKSE